KLRRADVLVLCAGFEERALSFLNDVVGQPSDFRVILINYLPYMNENRRVEIHDICRAASIPCSDVSYDRQNPSGFGDSLLDNVGSVRGRLYIDISGMSRLLIVQILVSIGIRDSGLDRTTILYAEAAEYPPK